LTPVFGAAGGIPKENAEEVTAGAGEGADQDDGSDPNVAVFDEAELEEVLLSTALVAGPPPNGLSQETHFIADFSFCTRQTLHLTLFS